jgi:hypothetical protein
MLTQQPKQPKRQQLPDRTRRGIVHYLQHHTDQKFAIYCNKDTATFGSSRSTFRARVKQYQQDLLRPQNQERLERLFKEYANGDADDTEEDNEEEMIRAGTSRKKATKKPAARSILNKKTDSLPEWDHDLEFYEVAGDDDDDDLEEIVEGNGNAMPRRAPHAPPAGLREGGKNKCKSFCLLCASRLTGTRSSYCFCS